MSRLILGIDPGKTAGGIVIINENCEVEFKYVISKKKTDLEIDYKRLADIFKDLDTESYIIGIEDVHSIFGSAAKATFNFGHICGFLRACCYCNDLNHILVPPKIWQKFVWVNEDIVFKKESKKVDTKSTSLNAAGRLFPNQSFRATKRSTTPADGLVDAALIAYYVLKNY